MSFLLKVIPTDLQGVDLKIFEVQTGEVLMGGGGGPFPVIRWAGGDDDKLFSTFSDNSVSVYDTHYCFSLSDIRPVVKFDDQIEDMCWSPTDSIFQGIYMLSYIFSSFICYVMMM